MENKSLKIIGIGGTNGSGKDSIGEILAANHGYFFKSMSDSLREECARRGISNKRENTAMVSAEWRREFGMAVLVDRVMQAYEQSDGNYKGVIMASLRHPAEADRIHELGGTVIWTDADPKIRYNRIVGNTRGARDADKVSFEEFLDQEQSEMRRAQNADSATISGQAVKQKSDLTITNNFDNLDELSESLASIFKFK